MSSVCLESKKGQDGCCLICNFDCVKEGRYICHSNPCQSCNEKCRFGSYYFGQKVEVPLK